MSNRGGLGAFLAGMASGYGTVMKFKRDDEEAQARREDREWEKSQRQRTLREQGEADQLKQDVKNAAAPVQVQTIAQTRPDTMDDRDVGQPGEQALQPAGFAVNGTRFDSRDQADREAAKQNATGASYDRVADVYRKAGRLDLYEAHKKMAEQARDEGAAELADLVRSNSPTLDDVKKAGEGGVSIKLPEKAIANFNGMGRWKLPEDAVVQAFAGKDATGKEVVDQRILTADGKVVLGSLNEAADFLGLSPAERRAAKRDDMRTGLQGDQLRATVAHQQGTLKVAERNSDTQRMTAQATIADQAARRGLERERLELDGRRVANEEAKTNAGTAPVMPKFDEAGARKRADEYVAEENKARLAAGQPRLTAAERAKGLQSFIDAEQESWRQRMVTDAALNTLVGSRNDPQAYAANWQRATAMGVDPKQLEAAGLKAPPQPTAAPPQAGAAAGGTGVPQRRDAAGAAPAPAAAPQPGSPIQQAPSGAVQAVQAVAASFQQMQAQLQQAAGNRNTPPTKLAELAQASQAARTALEQQLGRLSPRERAAVVAQLGLQGI